MGHKICKVFNTLNHSQSNYCNFKCIYPEVFKTGTASLVLALLILLGIENEAAAVQWSIISKWNSVLNQNIQLIEDVAGYNEKAFSIVFIEANQI